MENKKVLSAVKKVRTALTILRGLDGSGGSQMDRDAIGINLNEAIVSFKDEGYNPDAVEPEFQEGEQPGVEQHKAVLDPVPNPPVEEDEAPVKKAVTLAPKKAVVKPINKRR